MAVNGYALNLDAPNWSGASAHSVRAEIDQSLLNDGDNTVVVSGAAGGSIFYVNTIDVAYQRHYVAVNDMAQVQAGGNTVISIDGFTGSDISVFEITNANKPKFIKAVTIDTGALGQRVSFRAGSPLSTYLALTPDAVKTPLSVVVDAVSNLKKMGQWGGVHYCHPIRIC